jgi:ABC-type transport system involved in Fe-S cluster assembly fused permease/ATPase subunit
MYWKNSRYRPFHTSVPELKELLCAVSSFEYISKIYNQNDYILAKTRQLILKCQNLNVLTEHTCNTIGVVCLYYTFLDNDYSVDLCKFSDKYKVSSTTILKVYKKLSIALQE